MTSIDTHFYCEDISADRFKLDHEESHHALKVFRVSIGQEIIVGDGKGHFARAKAIKVKKQLELEVISRFEEKDHSSGLRLILTPLKQLDRLLFAIEKAIELGVSEVHIVSTQNTAKSFLKEEKIKKKAIAAFKQSRVSRIPLIQFHTSISEFESKMDIHLPCYFAHCYQRFSRKPITNVSNPSYFFIGPEADFTAEEVEKLSGKNWQGISLGNNRLRAETAAIYVSSFAYQLNNGNIVS